MSRSYLHNITVIDEYDEQIINFPSYYIPEKKDNIVEINEKYLKEVEKNKLLENKISEKL